VEALAAFQQFALEVVERALEHRRGGADPTGIAVEQLDLAFWPEGSLFIGHNVTQSAVRRRVEHVPDFRMEQEGSGHE